MGWIVAAGIALIILSVGMVEGAERMNSGWPREVTTQLGLLVRGLGAIVVIAAVLFVIAIVATGQTS